MIKGYLIRHQHGHANEQFVFLKPPTREQIDAVLDHDDDRYGQKCDQEWRDSDSVVMTVEVIGSDAIPKLIQEKLKNGQ